MRNRVSHPDFDRGKKETVGQKHVTETTYYKNALIYYSVSVHYIKQAFISYQTYATIPFIAREIR